VRRRLDVELVRRGLVPSRTRAVEVIGAGRVLVGGAPASTPARQVDGAESIAVLAADGPDFVSRGGHKLAAALDAFGIDVTGRTAVDVGSSTGGFTDCLLQRGATHVFAVDVGRSQLAWSLRGDERVTVMERTNVRDLAAGALSPRCCARSSTALRRVGSVSTRSLRLRSAAPTGTSSSSRTRGAVRQRLPARRSTRSWRGLTSRRPDDRRRVGAVGRPGAAS
jgi:ribosomal protein S4